MVFFYPQFLSRETLSTRFTRGTLVKQRIRKPQLRDEYNIYLKHLEPHKPRKTRFQSFSNVSKKKRRKSQVSKPAGLQNKAKPSERHGREARIPRAPLYGFFPAITCQQFSLVPFFLLLPPSRTVAP